jgi:putative restriction endonuclease
MRLYVAVTDKDWFALHASKPEVEEVNFRRPSPDATFKALPPGELLLFKLHSPDNFIAGGGFFTRFLQLPVNLVWDTFGGGKRRAPPVELFSGIAVKQFILGEKRPGEFDT